MDGESGIQNIIDKNEEPMVVVEGVRRSSRTRDLKVTEVGTPPPPALKDERDRWEFPDPRSRIRDPKFLHKVNEFLRDVGTDPDNISFTDSYSDWKKNLVRSNTPADVLNGDYNMAVVKVEPDEDLEEGSNLTSIKIETLDEFERPEQVEPDEDLEGGSNLTLIKTETVDEFEKPEQVEVEQRPGPDDGEGCDEMPITDAIELSELFLNCLNGGGGQRVVSDIFVDVDVEMAGMELDYQVFQDDGSCEVTPAGSEQLPVSSDDDDSDDDGHGQQNDNGNEHPLCIVVARSFYNALLRGE